MTPMMPNSWAQMIQNQQQPVMPQPPQIGGGPPGMMPNSFMDMLRMRQPGFMPQGGNGGPMPSPPMGGMQPAPWQPQRPVMPPFGASQPQPMEQPQMPMPANSFLRRPLGLQF